MPSLTELRLNAETAERQATMLTQQVARANNKTEHAELLTRAERAHEDAKKAQSVYLNALFNAERNRRFGGAGKAPPAY